MPFGVEPFDLFISFLSFVVLKLKRDFYEAFKRDFCLHE